MRNIHTHRSCTCPNVARLSDNQLIWDTKLKKARQMSNASVTVNNMDTQNRPPKHHRKMPDNSDWSDSKNEKDNQARAPILKTPPQKPTTSVLLFGSICK